MNDDYRKQPQKTAAAALNKVNKYNSINIHNKTVMGETEKAETKQHRSINLKSHKFILIDVQMQQSS